MGVVRTFQDVAPGPLSWQESRAEMCDFDALMWVGICALSTEERRSLVRWSFLPRHPSHAS